MRVKWKHVVENDNKAWGAIKEKRFFVTEIVSAAVSPEGLDCWTAATNGGQIPAQLVFPMARLVAETKLSELLERGWLDLSEFKAVETHGNTAEQQTEH